MTNRPATSFPLIACLESFLSPNLNIPSSPSSPALRLLSPPTAAKLKNLGNPRIRDMRALGHTAQVLSHIPISATPQMCMRLNDALETGTRMQNDKMVPLALLPSSRGEGRDAARELQRCITKLKFVGGVVPVGAGLEDESFEEVWGMAQRLGVPILLREGLPTEDQIAEYTQGLPNSVIAPIVAHLHSAHAASPMLILRLYLKGVFDRHLHLRLVIAHPGLLPSLLPRIDTVLSGVPAIDRPKRSFLDVWQHNFYFTTVDVLDLTSMHTLLEQIPIDHVLYASNYPLEERGRSLVTALRESTLLTNKAWEKLAWRNAEQLFKLKGPEQGPYSTNTRPLA
ncbi:amidohydrolase [Stagonosporopsis vannaccii]|nr:amidohydrolase [Stagonosporopsis vannaccii]